METAEIRIPQSEAGLLNVSTKSSRALEKSHLEHLAAFWY